MKIDAAFAQNLTRSVLSNFFASVDLQIFDVIAIGDSRVIDLHVYGKYRIWRSQLFNTDETSLLHSIEKVINKYLVYNDRDLLEDIVDTIVLRVIANYFTNKDGRFDDEIILDMLILMDKFASQTYEGKRIALAIAINNLENGNSNNFTEYFKYDFSKVLSSSIETVIEFDRNGKYCSYYEAREKDPDVYAPFFYSSLAKIAQDKIVITINYNGDVLIFYDRKMLFSKRRGSWSFYQFDAIINQIAFGNRAFSDILRKEILLSCIDVSFAKTGGCIGYIYRDYLKKALALVNDNDKLALEKTIKTKSLNMIFKEKRFDEIPRLQRKELLGIDGALLLGNDGKILCAGAIISLKQSTETGGGRTASAMELAKHGISFKISNDGPIIVFKNEQSIRIN
jgi:hypothetical protein